MPLSDTEAKILLAADKAGDGVAIIKVKRAAGMMGDTVDKSLSKLEAKGLVVVKRQTSGFRKAQPVTLTIFGKKVVAKLREIEGLINEAEKQVTRSERI